VPKLSTEVSILIDSASHWLSCCPSRWPPRLLTTIYARVSLGRSREDRRIHFFRDFHQRHRRIFAGVRRPTANVLSELSEDTATGPVAVISTEPYCTVGAGIAESRQQQQQQQPAAAGQCGLPAASLAAAARRRRRRGGRGGGFPCAAPACQGGRGGQQWTVRKASTHCFGDLFIVPRQTHLRSRCRGGDPQ
jgi:hypothetical protein